MINKRNCYILIPVYNEADSIVSVVGEIQKLGFRNIIVVDDGSKDNTLDLLKRKKIILVKHCANLGQGGALGTGFELAKKNHANCLVTLDGDGQHDPREIRRFMEIINKGYDVVLGRREFGKNMPLFNRFANLIADGLMNVLYGVRVHDSQCGFRSYSGRAIDLIKVDSSGYEFNSRVVGEIGRHKLRYKEIRIKTIYTTHSTAKIKKQDMINGVNTLFKLIFSV